MKILDSMALASRPEPGEPDGWIPGTERTWFLTEDLFYRERWEQEAEKWPEGTPVLLSLEHWPTMTEGQREKWREQWAKFRSARPEVYCMGYLGGPEWRQSSEHQERWQSQNNERVAAASLTGPDLNSLCLECYETRAPDNPEAHQEQLYRTFAETDRLAQGSALGFTMVLQPYQVWGWDDGQNGMHSWGALVHQSVWQMFINEAEALVDNVCIWSGGVDPAKLTEGILCPGFQWNHIEFKQFDLQLMLGLERKPWGAWVEHYGGQLEVWVSQVINQLGIQGSGENGETANN